MSDRRVPISERASWLIRRGTPSAESLTPGPIDRLRGKEALDRFDLDETFDTLYEMTRGNPGLRLKRKFSPVGHVWNHLRGDNYPFTSARLSGPRGARADFMDRLVFEGFRATSKQSISFRSVEVEHASPDALPAGVALAERLGNGDRVSIRPDGFWHELRTTDDGQPEALAVLEELGCVPLDTPGRDQTIIRFAYGRSPAENDTAAVAPSAA